MRDAFERARTVGVTSAVARCLWLVLHLYFSIRSLGRSAVDRVFHLLGLAFLEPRRGLSFCARKLRRLMVRSCVPRRRPLARPSRVRPDHARTARSPPPPPSLTTLPVPVPRAGARHGRGALPARRRAPPPAPHARHRRQRPRRGDGVPLVRRVSPRVGRRGGHPKRLRLRPGRIRPRLRLATRRARGQGDDGERRARRGAPGVHVRPPPRGRRRRHHSNDGTIRVRRGRHRQARRVAANLRAIGEGVVGDGNGIGDDDGGSVVWRRRRRGARGRRAAMGRGERGRDGDGDARASDARGPTTPAALEAWMEARGSMLPNVDVTVVFGRHFHLSGYPPWQLHKAEMYHRRSLRGFTRKSLGEILRRYAGVSQRFGR